MFKSQGLGLPIWQKGGGTATGPNCKGGTWVTSPKVRGCLLGSRVTPELGSPYHWVQPPKQHRSVPALWRGVQKPVNQICLQYPSGSCWDLDWSSCNEALPRSFPLWDVRDPGGEDRLLPVSSGSGKGEKLACTEALVDARLSAGGPAHLPNAQAQLEDAYKATHDTRDNTTETPTTAVPEVVKASEPFSFCQFHFIPPHFLWPPLQRPCGQLRECGGRERTPTSPLAV